MRRVNKETTQQPVYINIKESRDIKRALLEGVKDTLLLLQRREILKKTREEKLHVINQLAETVKELKEMDVRLKSALPAIDKNIIKSREEKEHKKTPAKKQKEGEKEEKGKEEKEVVKRELSDIEKLEEEIKEIEGKLSSLG